MPEDVGALGARVRAAPGSADAAAVAGTRNSHANKLKADKLSVAVQVRPLVACELCVNDPGGFYDG